MVKNFYKNKRVLITGATGFKGAWLSYWLHLLEAKVYGLGYNPNKNKNLFYNLKLDKKIKLKLFDIRDKKKLKKFISLSKPQIIFHLAAQPLILDSYNKPYLTYTVNSIGTLNVLETVRETDSVKSLICITSDKCYESNYSTKGFKEDDKLGGKDPYSGSKASAEIMIKSYQESFFKYKKCGLASGRAGNVIGGGDWAEDRLIPDILRAFKLNKPVIIRNPKATRPWQHVLEPLSGYLLLAEKLFYDPVRFSGGWNYGPCYDDVKSVDWILDYMTKLWPNSSWRLDSSINPHEANLLKLDISKAESQLNWIPTWNLETSLEKIVEWENLWDSGADMHRVCLSEIKQFIKDSSKNVQN